MAVRLTFARPGVRADRPLLLRRPGPPTATSWASRR